MLTIFLFLYLNLSIILAGGLLSGNQEVSYHEYRLQRAALDINPVYCEVPASNYNISMVTAVQGLELHECGTCLKIHPTTDPSNYHFIMALDKGGKGLDVNSDTFRILKKGDLQGLLHVHWEIVNSLHCKDAITGSFNLPGYTNNLHLPFMESTGSTDKTHTLTQEPPKVAVKNENQRTAIPVEGPQGHEQLDVIDTHKGSK
ncbi:hypothetical protein K502DRAFT_351698 [Neoconidiobolus thromboides FSU 785]|nr:hypothetical protein K502DRAFT_351698 [Neoconidiobolus thromboides FSU 785]